MGRADSISVAFIRCATLLFPAVLLAACSVAPVQRPAKDGMPADPASAFPAPAAGEPTPAPVPAPAQLASATSVRAAIPASASTRRAATRPTPSLQYAAIEEVRAVVDPLPLARPIDLTASPDDLWVRIRNGFGMPDLNGPLVLDRQIWYAARPSVLKTILQRSRRYLYHIVDELERRGMPTELALLPMVESAFNPMAYSRAKASGLWQFIPSTGRNYKLQQNWWYDERRDIVASTNAALDYLQFLYDMHGDWHLALASYNWGENAVARAIERNKARKLPTDYMNLTMPLETRYYVPKLQALKNIVANPAAFGIDLDPIPNQPYFVTVAKTQNIDIRTAAKLAEMPVEELIALNPGFKRPVIVATQSPMLVLPADRADTFLANLENHDTPLSSWQTYTMKPGEKLERVAAAHGITLARLKQVNGIGPRAKAPPSHQIIVPVKGSRAAVEPLPAVFHPPPDPELRSRRAVYSVKKGDTLPRIAQRYRVSADDLRRWNEVGRLTVGQKLQILLPQATAKGRPTVRKGKSAVAHRSAGRAKPPARVVQR